MAKSTLPLHPQHNNMDKDRFITVHVDKWAKDIKLGAFDKRQLQTIANFKYQGWEFIGTDQRRFPVIESPAGDQWSVMTDGSPAPVHSVVTRWDGPTDRAKKIARARELTAEDVVVRGAGGSDVYAIRKQVIDELAVLEWEFIRNPDHELAQAMQDLRRKMDDLDNRVIIARQLADLGPMPEVDEDEDEVFDAPHNY